MILMKKQSILMLALFAHACILSAQTTVAESHHPTEMGFVMQAHFFDFEDMNRVLGNQRYPTLAAGGLNIEFSNRKRIKNTRWLGENALGYGFVASENPQVAGYQTSFREWSLNSRFVYDVRRDKRFQILPYAGFGVRYQRLRLYEGVPNNGNFGQLTNGDFRQITLTDWPFHLDAGLSLEQNFPLREVNLAVGVRAGYLLMLGSDWAVDGSYVTDLPRPDSGVPYVGLVVRTSARR
jgi:hypothetical protein